MADALTIRGLEVRYGDRVALTDVDLDVPAGTSLAVIGPNGSGKSTLLRAVAGLAEPTAGTIARPGSGTVAMVLQSTEVDRSLPISVRDTVGLGRYPRVGLLRRFAAADRAAIAASLDRLDIADLADRQLHHLSGGQRQRVMVAQGLAQEADLLLLDEPVTGLDLVSRQAILDAVDAELAAGRTVVTTTHDLDDARRCDQVLLVAGRPVALGPPAEVLRDDALRRAFGSQVVRLGADGDLLLDDPHHDHHDHAEHPDHPRHTDQPHHHH